MKEKLNKKTFGIIAAALLILLVGWYALNSIPKANTAAPQGALAEHGTSTLIKLETDGDRVLFASSTCVARIVTTSTSSIRIKFSDHADFTLGTNIGHFQGASTTVSYDSGIYGCGLWTARNLGDIGMTTTVTEFRGFR